MPTVLRFFIVLCVLPLGCTDADAPLSSAERFRIDSIGTAQIRELRREMDSLCVLETEARMPFLIDSIKKERLREIEILTKGQQR